MTVVHFTLSKSRAGKTFISWLLAQYQLSNGQPLKLYDLDPNFSLCRFKALNAKSLNLAVSKTDGSIDFDINKLVEIIKTTYSDLLVDTTSDMFNAIVNALRKDHELLIKQLKELDVNIVLHMPVAGGEYARDECIKCINEVLSSVNDVSVIVWLNHYPKPVFNESVDPNQNELKNYFADKPSLKYIVNLPNLSSGDTITRDNDQLLLKNILRENRIFDEILDPQHYKYAEDPYLNGVPVFVLTDYQISFLRDEFEKSVQNVAEIAS